MLIFLLTAIFLYFSALLGFALFTYSFFWYETFNSNHRHHLQQISKNKIGRWFTRGIISSFISQNLVVFFFPLRFWRSLWNPQPDSSCSSPPVLLIHGLYHNVSAWVIYRWILRQRGYRNTYAFGYSSIDNSFAELLNKLAEEVSRISAAFPDQRIVLIGHSLGGLLAKAYVEDLRSREKVAVLVTLGSPHQGTKLAALGTSSLARSLSYQGELFTNLQQRALPSEVPKLAIYSPIDNMVLPNESLQPTEPGWSCLESFPVSHVAMLYDRRLAKLVVEYLQVRSESS